MNSTRVITVIMFTDDKGTTREEDVIPRNGFYHAPSGHFISGVSVARDQITIYIHKFPELISSHFDFGQGKARKK
jgi:hypothetical protein